MELISILVMVAFYSELIWYVWFWFVLHKTVTRHKRLKSLYLWGLTVSIQEAADAGKF